MITEVDRILYLMENKSMALNDINSKIIQNSELTCEYEELENMLDDLKLNNQVEFEFIYSDLIFTNTLKDLENNISIYKGNIS